VFDIVGIRVRRLGVRRFAQFAQKMLVHGTGRWAVRLHDTGVWVLAVL